MNEDGGVEDTNSVRLEWDQVLSFDEKKVVVEEETRTRLESHEAENIATVFQQ